MKKQLLIPALALVALAVCAAPKKSDPVVMTVAGKDIHQSEFQYLYEKNNRQQLAPQSLEEYVDMFVVYKLKVADAEAAGIDTTETFRKEFDGYCAELAAPYMRDSLVEKRLIDEAYARMATQRKVSHILVPLGSTAAEREANRALLAAVRDSIVNHGADFAEMARRHSADRSALRNGGSMGWFGPGRFPYPFELAAYTTPVGTVSEVFEDAPYGYHIVYAEAERPNAGRVEARHILKLTQGRSPEEAQAQKARIDSIYTLLQGGADFAELARKESEDPGSAAEGGKLPAFGAGMMVPEFEEAAFSLGAGEISKPFATAYGYHIVQTLEHLGIGSLEEELDGIKAQIGRDQRSQMPEQERIAQFKTLYGCSVDSAALTALRTRLAADTVTPPVAIKALCADATPIARIGSRSLTVGEMASLVPDNVRAASADAYTTFESALSTGVDDAVRSEARRRLEAENADYRNLVGEYRDGILLFEISNRNVWDRSTADREGLEAHFAANRSAYSWDRPHYKGYVVFATSDSVATAARTFLADNKVERDSLVKTLRDNFGRDVKVERVTTGRGDNAIVDHIAFGGERPEAPGRWVAWFSYDGRVIDAPEEAADVRGAVAADYQQTLEKAWVESLRAKYPVKLNKKALKKLGMK